jgi:glycosyltransferase involved in cell wall biosynthesis
VSAEAPLRVLVVHNWYRSEMPSGEDRVVEQEMALLESGGHEVSFFGRHSDDIAGMPLREKVLVPLRVPWNRAVREELGQVLQRTRPDVVHVHSTFPLLSPSVVAACADTATPAVATLHNYSLICGTGTMLREGAPCTRCVPTRGAAATVHGCYRGSRLASLPVSVGLAVNRRRWLDGIARFFCLSSAQLQILVDHGIPPERLALKPNVVPEPPVRWAGEGEHVLYVGRLTEEKGVRLLVAAWDRLGRDGGVGLPLVVAGSGPLLDELRGWAAGRADVRVLGLQTRERCAELMARAATVVVPSVWPEVFGLVAVEAMAAGVPVVASEHGSFVEIVDDGVTGLLHRPGDAGSLADAISRVVPAREHFALGEAARKRYERDYAPDAGLAALVAGYRAALADPVGPARA